MDENNKKEKHFAKGSILKSEPPDDTFNDEAGILSLLILQICKVWWPIKIGGAVKRR